MIDADVYSNVLVFNLDLAGEINIILTKETIGYEILNGFKGANFLLNIWPFR